MISICIPTYNRVAYLKEALDSICDQFNDTNVIENIEVYILDNQSTDDTQSIAKSFADRFSNIHYLKDCEKRGMGQGIIHASYLATGDYVWIFSDDDLMYPGSLKKILSILSEQPTDLILLNINSFVEKNKIHQTNLFKETKNQYLKNRSEFWVYLNNKFYYDIDYFTTYCSNWILKKNYFDKTKDLFEIYNKKLDLFPFPSLVFYSGVDFSTKIIAEPLVMFRADNASWVRKNPIRNFFYADSLWRHHYNNIIKFNKQYLPPNFVINVCIKYLLKIKDFLFLLLVLTLKRVGLFGIVRDIYKKLVV